MHKRRKVEHEKEEEEDEEIREDINEEQQQQQQQQEEEEEGSLAGAQAQAHAAMPREDAEMAEAREGLGHSHETNGARGHGEVDSDAVELLEGEKRRLENALRHLHRSNDELQEALSAGPDEDFEQAIRENKDVMVRMNKELEQLEKDIAAARAFTHYQQVPQTGADQGWL